MPDQIPFSRLKQICDDRRREYDRAQGAYDTALKNLLKDTGVETVEAAKEVLVKLERKEAKAQAAYNAAVVAFTEKYPDVLKDA